MKSFYFLIFLIATSCINRPEKPILEIGKEKENLKIFEKIEYNWWQNFNDPTLNKVVKMAILNNYDYKIVQNKIITTRNNLLNANSNFTAKSKISFFLKNSSYFKLFYSQNKVTNYFINGFDTSWELDLFGTNFYSTQLAKSLQEISNDNKNYILVSLIAEVVSNYSQIKASQNKALIEEKILKYYEEILKFNAEERKDLAYNQDLEVIKNEIINSKINLSEAKTKIKILSKNLEVLLNQNNLEKLLSENKNIPTLSGELIFEVPTTVLRNRPDIKNSEKELEIITNLGNKNIDKIFPKISLTSFLDFNNKEENFLQNLRDETSISRNISSPTLNFGAIITDYKISKPEEKKALLNYKTKVLMAFSDIEFSLSNFFKEEEKFKLSTKKYALAQIISKLNKEKYLNGLVSYSQYLNSEIDFLKVEKEKINSELRLFMRSATFYKAIGGGLEKEKSNLEKNKTNLSNKKRFKLGVTS